MSIVSMVVYLDYVYAPGILSCSIKKLALFTTVKKLDLLSCFKWNFCDSVYIIMSFVLFNP